MTDPARFPPEARLLLACARSALDAEARQALGQAAVPGLDWDWLLALAQRHAMQPLLYRHLDALPADRVPRRILVELWGQHARRTHANTAMAQELLHLLTLLDAQSIPAIPYKGPALAALLHGDVAMRAFADLDVLLRPADVLRAKALLLSLGYRPAYALAPAVEAAFLASPNQHHLVMVHDERSIAVELHWRTDPDFAVERLQDPRWWDALDRQDLAQGTVRSLVPRELLLVLCLHGSKHFWSSLGWLVDVAELAHRQSGADWDWILAQARSLGGERRLALGLHLASDLLGAPVPPGLQQRMAAVATHRGLDRRITQTWFTREPHHWGAGASLRLNLRLDDGAHRRVQRAARLLFTPSLAEWAAWPLPRALHFLYPPMRWARLLRKHALRRAA